MTTLNECKMFKYNSSEESMIYTKFNLGDESNQSDPMDEQDLEYHHTDKSKRVQHNSLIIKKNDQSNLYNLESKYKAKFTLSKIQH